jgi:hypothetical protein
MTRANNKPIKHDSQNIFVNKNSLKIPKWLSDAVNRRRTNNTTARRKRQKVKQRSTKQLHRKLKIEQYERQ